MVSKTAERQRALTPVRTQIQAPDALQRRVHFQGVGELGEGFRRVCATAILVNTAERIVVQAANKRRGSSAGADACAHKDGGR